MKRLKHAHTKVAALLAGAMLLSGVLSGCGGLPSSNGEEPTHLNFGCYSYSDSLDPITTVNSSWAGMRYGILECLFRFDSQVVAQPWLCDTYELSDDYTTWTLHIREGVQFSNGNPVTPSAVQAAFERLYAETDADRGGTGNSNPEVYLPEPELTADEVELLTSPMELTDYKDAIMEAMYRGTKRNVESEPEGKNTAAG